MLAALIGLLVLALVVQWVFASPERGEIRKLRDANARLSTDLARSAEELARRDRERDAVVAYARRPV